VSCTGNPHRGAAVARSAPPHKGPTFAVGLLPSVRSIFYLISTGGEMCLFLILLWCSAIVGRCGGPSHSRFGAFNSPVRLGEFPVQAATRTRSQAVDLSQCFLDQTAVAGANGWKFPFRREKPGICPRWSSRPVPKLGATTVAIRPNAFVCSVGSTLRRILARRCAAKVIHPIAPHARLPRNDGGRLPRRA
jgi:hypothetical protein